MHEDEFSVDVASVRAMLRAQFPDWSEQNVEAVRPVGSDNFMFRLGTELVVRLPRHPGAVERIEKELRWLPRLAPILPLEVPVPVGRGEPDEHYRFPWSISRWIDGEQATPELGDDPESADVLGQFVACARRIDWAGGPTPGPHNAFRGESLVHRDIPTRLAIAKLAESFQSEALVETWEDALGAEPWPGPPCWIHGDLLPVNLLSRVSELAGVIDFGCLGVGDPACDLMAAWTFCSATTRSTFLEAAEADEEMERRGRGWALSFGVIALDYYRRTNPQLAQVAASAIHEASADRR